MYLSSKQSIILALAVLGLFFGLTYVLVETKQNEASEDRAAKVTESSIRSDEAMFASESSQTSSAASAKDPDFVLHNFHRSESQDGHKLWEVKARIGKYVPEQNIVKVKDAILWVYKERDETIILDASEAFLSLEKGALSKAKLSGGITVTADDEITLTTQTATYDKKTESITTSDVVEISGDAINIKGEDLFADLDKKEFTLSRNVSSVIVPKKLKDKKEKNE